MPANDVRVVDGAKVRLGAHLAHGTTIMAGASYVNYNAGTLGRGMIEGRISSSVIVGAETDVGGGASILGVLSGTDGKPITIGKDCLLGANSVTGFSLGDHCVVDAGIAILKGSQITITKKDGQAIAKYNPGFTVADETMVFKGKDLAGLNAIHYRVNTLNGQMRAILSYKVAGIKDVVPKPPGDLTKGLNDMLHQ